MTRPRANSRRQHPLPNPTASATNSPAGATQTFKRCRLCDAAKPTTEFHRHHATRDRLRHECRTCRSKQLTAYRSQGPAFREPPENKRSHHLRRNYGITVGDYEAKLRSQGGGCAICGSLCTSGRRLAVDHDHTTGVLRGLLCMHHNQGLGKFQDNPELLDRAAAYLRLHAPTH